MKRIGRSKSGDDPQITQIKKTKDYIATDKACRDIPNKSDPQEIRSALIRVICVICGKQILEKKTHLHKVSEPQLYCLTKPILV